MKNIIYWVFLFGIAYPLQAQYSQDVIGSLGSGTSPDASLSGLQNNTNVDLRTGTPSVNIPLYSMTTGNFSLPISISYLARGIKVGQQAGVVGMGWNLNTAPIITREVKGVPDFTTSTIKNEENRYPIFHKSYFGLTADQPVTDFSTFPDCNNPSNRESCLDESFKDFYDYRREFYSPRTRITKTFDSEPDLFKLNFGGQQHVFVFDANDNRFKEIGRSNLRLEFEIGEVEIDYEELGNLQHVNEEVLYDIIKFVITDANGNQYHFGTYDQIITDTYYSSRANRKHNTAWYVDKIITASNRVIQFTYEHEIIVEENNPFEYCTNYYNTNYEISPIEKPMPERLRENDFLQQSLMIINRLKQIQTATQQCQFLYTKDRKDVAGNMSKLYKLEVRDRQNDRKVKQIGFFYEEVIFTRRGRMGYR